MPDRIIILPGGKICFVELKAPGQKPRPLQTRQMQRLTDLGCMARTLDNPQKIPEIINEIQAT